MAINILSTFYFILYHVVNLSIFFNYFLIKLSIINCYFFCENFNLKKDLKTAIITTIIKKKHFEKRKEDLLIMQLAIHSDCKNVMNATGATSINN